MRGARAAVASMPFDPVVGMLVQMMHELIETNSDDANTRAAVLWWLIHLPLLSREGRFHAAQHPNRPWLVTFEVHNVETYGGQRIFYDEYLSYVHPSIDIEIADPGLRRPPCHPHLLPLLEDKKLKRRWLATNLLGGEHFNEHSKTYKEAALKTLEDRLLFVRRITTYQTMEKELHDKSAIRDPNLYVTTTGLCAVPLPRAVVCFVAFLRFQHRFLLEQAPSQNIGPLRTRCSLVSCERPIRPERSPFDQYDSQDSHDVTSLSDSILPRKVKNPQYWHALRTREIKHLDPTAMPRMRAQVTNDELLKPRGEAELRPFAHAACYAFCSNYCRKEFFKRYEAQLMCIPCSELEPARAARAKRNGRPSSIAQQFQVALERNDQV